MYKAFFKRFFDIVFSFSGIVLLSWLLIFISLAIIIDDAGSIIGTTAENPVKSRVCGIIV